MPRTKREFETRLREARRHIRSSAEAAHLRGDYRLCRLLDEDADAVSEAILKLGVEEYDDNDTTGRMQRESEEAARSRKVRCEGMIARERVKPIGELLG